MRHLDAGRRRRRVRVLFPREPLDPIPDVISRPFRRGSQQPVSLDRRGEFDLFHFASENSQVVYYVYSSHGSAFMRIGASLVSCLSVAVGNLKNPLTVLGTWITVRKGVVLCAVPKNPPSGLKAQARPVSGRVGVPLTSVQLEVLMTVRYGLLR